MIIVSGVFEVLPGEQAEFLRGRHGLMTRSRAEKGCLEYTFSADPLDPSRVLLFEKWASIEDLRAHQEAGRAPAPKEGVPEEEPLPAKSAAVSFFEVVAEVTP